MIDREILATRLSKLREALRRLRPIAAKPHAEYRASEIDQALAEHYLRLSLEAMLDTGNHLSPPFQGGVARSAGVVPRLLLPPARPIQGVPTSWRLYKN